MEKSVLPSLSFGREICGERSAGGRREWMVTNGLGGYAAGTVAGHLSRRYHGLLVASLRPPVERTLLVTKIDEVIEYGNEIFALGTNHWSDGTVDPEGYRYLEQFSLRSRDPVWTYALGDALLVKRIGMKYRQNATFVRYRVPRSSEPLTLRLKLLINNRDHHLLRTRRTEVPEVRSRAGRLRMEWPGGVVTEAKASGGEWTAEEQWYRNFFLAMEDQRGLSSVEHHFCAGTLRATCSEGEELIVWIGEGNQSFSPVREVVNENRQRIQTLMEGWNGEEHPDDSPHWIRRLVVASDDFMVRRSRPDGTEGWSVIAGYPWFTDWGRDTMISLPGLLLCTGRESIAMDVLRTYLDHLDRGLIPNRFPDAGGSPEYNTVDATLWLIEAVHRVWKRTGDRAFLEEIYPSLQEIVRRHREGTRHGIGVDPSDGLIKAGEPGLQLTWMDAKVGNEVITPRRGKPVEVNALWYNALRIMQRLAGDLDRSGDPYGPMAQATREGFERFWNPERGACHDVLDGPEGTDSAIRPNQILAVGLSHSPLDEDRRRAVVEVCQRRLITTLGLRSLDPGHSDYRPVYAGAPEERDRAYHQGTVWSWLIGPFVRAHLRVHGQPRAAERFLKGFRHHLMDRGLGSVSEIFDGEPPHHPRGCPYQAWGVAAVLQARDAIQHAE